MSGNIINNYLNSDGDNNNDNASPPPLVITLNSNGCFKYLKDGNSIELNKNVQATDIESIKIGDNEIKNMSAEELKTAIDNIIPKVEIQKFEDSASAAIPVADGFEKINQELINKIGDLNKIIKPSDKEIFEIFFKDSTEYLKNEDGSEITVETMLSNPTKILHKKASRFGKLSLSNKNDLQKLDKLVDAVLQKRKTFDDALKKLIDNGESKFYNFKKFIDDKDTTFSNGGTYDKTLKSIYNYYDKDNKLKEMNGLEFYFKNLSVDGYVDVNSNKSNNGSPGTKYGDSDLNNKISLMTKYSKNFAKGVENAEKGKKGGRKSRKLSKGGRRRRTRSNKFA